MAQSRTLSVGMDVHKETLAVASVAKDHDAEPLAYTRANLSTVRASA